MKLPLAVTHPHLADEWDNSNTFSMADVTTGSHRKAIWRCKLEQSHVWSAKINSRAGVTKSGCPYCRGLKVNTSNCIATTHPQLVKEWHPNNVVQLTKITIGSEQKIRWICQNNSKHIWSATANERRRGRNCPYCAGKKVLYSDSLAVRYPEIAKEWHSDNKLRASEILPSSNKKITWICQHNHVWSAKVYNRTGNKSCCPKCNHLVSKPETQWLDSLKVPLRQYGIKVEGRRYKVDGYDPETKTVYEFLGDFWHGNPETFPDPFAWNPRTKCQMYHLYKRTTKREKMIRTAGYNYVYIWESEWKQSIKIDLLASTVIRVDF